MAQFLNDQNIKKKDRKKRYYIFYIWTIYGRNNEEILNFEKIEFSDTPKYKILNKFSLKYFGNRKLLYKKLFQKFLGANLTSLGE